MPRSQWKPSHTKPLLSSQPLGSNFFRPHGLSAQKGQLQKEHTSEIYLVSRAACVDPSFLGKTVHIHTGKSYLKVTVNEAMLQRKFGEFALTRRLANHTKKTKKKKN